MRSNKYRQLKQMAARLETDYSRYHTRKKLVPNPHDPESGGYEVTLHRVGHNATHDFYLGVEPSLDCWVVLTTYFDSKTGEPVEEVNLTHQLPSYLGHW